MEVDSEDKAEEEGNNGENAEELQRGSNADMEIRAEGEKGARQVNIAVSHEGLAGSLRGLKETNINVRLQTHEASIGPTRRQEKILKDVTNKSEIRPALSKASRPITKVSGANQKENVKLLKWAEQAL